MIRPERLDAVLPPALRRLSRLVPLDSGDISALEASLRECSAAPARRELLGEGQEITSPKLVVSGWAAHVRLLPDGRRQLLGFLLPGELFGLARHARPISVTAVIALTEVSVCPAPPAISPQLAEAYTLSKTLEEAYFLNHITRLGRLNAQERIGDLLLEFYERLNLAGLISHDGFRLPLTQETMADALGLTPVHVNRVLQLMRREGGLHWTGGRVTLPDPVSLGIKLGRTPMRVSALSLADRLGGGEG